jgi:hypothetical protein
LAKVINQRLGKRNKFAADGLEGESKLLGNILICLDNLSLLVGKLGNLLVQIGELLSENLVVVLAESIAFVFLINVVDEFDIGKGHFIGLDAF